MPVKKRTIIFAYLRNNREPCHHREMDERTSIFTVVPNCGHLAEDKYDEYETIRVALIQSTH